jgi:hypothetical protein
MRLNRIGFCVIDQKYKPYSCEFDAMTYLNLTDLRGLGETEKALLDNAAKKIENVIENTNDAAGKAGLDLELMQKGLIATLIVTTARFAELYNKSEDKEALAFAVMRCMAEALFDALAFPAQEGFWTRPERPSKP